MTAAPPGRPHLEIDPGIRFGTPQIHGISSDNIAGQVWAGDSVDSVGSNYGLSRHEVLLCCWWEWQTHDGRTRRGRWAHRAARSLAGWPDAPPVAELPAPPSRADV